MSAAALTMTASVRLLVDIDVGSMVIDHNVQQAHDLAIAKATSMLPRLFDSKYCSLMAPPIVTITMRHKERG